MALMQLDPEQVARCRAPLPQAFTLPPTAYTDPNVFAAEVRHIFSRNWICVGRIEQVTEPGDYFCVDVVNQPIIVARDTHGELNAMSSICAHRAMPVAATKGNATRFVCPYHQWTYELDGRLRSAPMMEGAENFQTCDHQLPPVALEVWHGFILVNLDQDASALAPTISGLESLIKDYEFENLRVVGSLQFDSPWNWKILVENFMEAYHHIGPHKTTFEPMYPARDSSIPDNQGQPWSFLRMPGPPPPTDELSCFPKLPDNRRNELFAACVFPTFLFAAANTYGAWYQLSPNGVDSMDLQIHMLIHKDFVEHIDEATLEEMRQAFHGIHSEDIVVNQGPWRGLQAGLTRQGRLSPYEKSIWQLNQLWADRLQLGDRPK